MEKHPFEPIGLERLEGFICEVCGCWIPAPEDGPWDDVVCPDCGTVLIDPDGEPRGVYLREDAE